MGFHAIYVNTFKKLIVRIIYNIFFGPLYRFKIFRNVVIACLIDPFKVININKNNIIFRLNVFSYTAKKMIIEFCNAQTENETQNWLNENLKDNDVFMDVGGNIGAYIIYANKLKKLKSSIAIEASSINTKELLQNIYLNNLENSNIKVIHAAAGDENKLDFFDIPNIRTADGHGKVTSKIGENIGMSFRKKYGDHSLQEVVNLRKIDDILSELNLQKPNIILMDIDAHEVSALKGMTSLLSSKELRAILIELRGSTFHSVNKIFNSFNFYSKGILTKDVGNLIYTKRK